ncbi:unnamed protein product [Leptidea sinapis]|uniref:Uncharacterized protein n=1 Tax=Leptidea sinapis TaxID=189913 RepID=A0A5E4QMC0_9NEOP|nr:unnamed protein product [Leptidea sinapis]
MQFNQPIYNGPANGYHGTCQIPFRYTDVKGEGDVTSVMFPDGTVQFYFVPTLRREKFVPYSNAHNPNIYPTLRTVGNELWYIRSIPYPVLGNQFLGQNINVGDPFLRSYFLSKSNLAPPVEFCQKFHNDNSSSTSDIHYFYPSLRSFCKATKRGVSIQVDGPRKVTTSCQSEQRCSCNGDAKRHKEKILNINTSSAMSIDSENSYRTKSKPTYNKKSKRKPKTRCHCKTRSDKVDKQSTTYTDRACNSMSPPRRHNSWEDNVYKLTLSDSCATASCCDQTCVCDYTTDSSK